MVTAGSVRNLNHLYAYANRDFESKKNVGLGK